MKNIIESKETMRKVRSDFDTTTEYVVCVEGCTEEEKRTVQQAFFDVGIKWFGSDAIYQHLDVVQYSNATKSGKPILLGWRTLHSNISITAKEFLEMVYEPSESCRLRSIDNKKLIDLLIDNNIQWPEGAEGVVQDSDGEVKFYTGEKPCIPHGVWLRDRDNDYEELYLQTASDYETAIITKTDWENRKVDKKAMFADIKVGDKVWDIRHGWGVVAELTDYSDYPICADFEHGYDTYTWDGYYDLLDINPSLFWDEIEIKAPPKPLPDLESDTKVIVWNNITPKTKRYFSHFSSSGKIVCFANGMASWTTKKVSEWDNWELAE